MHMLTLLSLQVLFERGKIRLTGCQFYSIFQTNTIRIPEKMTTFVMNIYQDDLSLSKRNEH